MHWYTFFVCLHLCIWQTLLSKAIFVFWFVLLLLLPSDFPGIYFGPVFNITLQGKPKVGLKVEEEFFKTLCSVSATTQESSKSSLRCFQPDGVFHLPFYQSSVQFFKKVLLVLQT